MKYRQPITLLREVVSMILRENQDDTSLGFYRSRNSGMILGVTYDVDSVKTVCDSARGDIQDLESTFRREMYYSIIGMIRIEKPLHPCNGAWEVKNSAGPGQGKLVYAMGYFLSPSGKLIADRFSVSRKAQNSWKRVRKKSEGEPLDDIDNRKTPPESDDCVVWTVTGKDVEHPYLEDGLKDEETADALNRSYEMGTMGYDFVTMEKRSEEFLKYLPFRAQRIDQIIDDCAQEFFQKHYYES